jgi:hypothetical protein
MTRKTFDILTSAVGLALAVVLLVAGGLALWGHNYISNEVHSQLASQKIVFPASNSPSVKAPEFAAMRQYGGQQLTTGAQAEVYADHFIANHLNEISGGLTYSQLSAKAMAQPTNVKLAGQVATVFKGTTLRGLLLNAYAFGTVATLAGIAAVVAFSGGFVLLVLSAVGFAHVRRVPAGAEIFA